jgi:predicted O-linked N-acetylglucosamine transferase (SPINDLY family)
LGVFAHRAAPVQAHYLGYFASTGLTEMDYWLGDAALIPPEAESHFSETVWRLPRTWVSYDARNDAPAVAWQPDTQGVCRLGSFNALPKLSDQTLALWARVLKLIPHACLLLKANALDEGDNRERLEEKFLKLGIAAHRLELHGFSASWRDHMDLYNRVDLALDPVGAHAGVTTTCDALWMGAPVISLAGDRMAQRQGASLLTALGHPEWVADSEDAYVAKVVALANDLPLRQTLRPAQRALMQSSALCDAKGLARELENAYEAMLQRRREQTFLTEA